MERGSVEMVDETNGPCSIALSGLGGRCATLGLTETMPVTMIENKVLSGVLIRVMDTVYPRLNWRQSKPIPKLFL